MAFRLGRPGLKLRPGRAEVRVSPREVERLEVKHRQLAEVTLQWHELLRDMESSGESGDPRYESYYRAYLDARRQEKQAELAAFNARRGLAS